MEEQARVLPRGRGGSHVVLGAEAALGAQGRQQSRGGRRLPRADGLRHRRLLRTEVHDEEGHDSASAAAEYGLRAIEGRLQSGEEQSPERHATTTTAAAAVLVRRRLAIGGAPVQPVQGVSDQGRGIGVGGGTGAVAQPTTQVSSWRFCLIPLIYCFKFVLDALKLEFRIRSSERSFSRVQTHTKT